jgi:hypothetical protein
MRFPLVNLEDRFRGVLDLRQYGMNDSNVSEPDPRAQALDRQLVAVGRPTSHNPGYSSPRTAKHLNGKQP